MFLHQIGLGYMERYMKFTRLDDLRTAINSMEKAVSVTTDDNPNFPGLISDLGVSFLRLFNRTGNLDDISGAIVNQRRAIQHIPDGHKDLPALLGNLGVSLLSRFQCTNDMDDITEAIENLQYAVQSTLGGHLYVHLPDWLKALGRSCMHRFERTGDLDDISEAIKNLQHAVRLIPDRHADFPALLNDLGTSFYRRFKCMRDLNDISGAIENQRRAVQLTPDGHEALAGLLGSLGTSFSERFDRTGDLDDICDAIKNLRRAVELTPDGHANFLNLLTNFGMALSYRFNHSGNQDDISEAFKLQQRAVDLNPDGGANLPARLNNLGSSYAHRFDHTGDPDDICEAIRNKRRAVQLIPDGHADLPDLLSSLGTSLSSRFKYSGDAQDISEAIKHQRRTVQLTPDGHGDLPARLDSLGASLSARFGHIGDLDDISEAIKNQYRAVLLSPDGHSNLPRLLTNLGLSLSSRFDHTGNLDDMSEAIKSHQRAVPLIPLGHADLPITLTNLATSLSRRFERTGDQDDMSEAIKFQRCAVETVQAADAQFSYVLNNLGALLSVRFQRTGDLADISEAIENQQLALQHSPRSSELPSWLSNLGVSFSNRFDRTGDLNDISEAIKNIQRAVELTPSGHTNLPSWLDNLGTTFVRRFRRNGDPESLENAIFSYRRSATSTNGPPHIRLLAANRWATLLKNSPCEPSQLLEAHACVVQLLSLVSGLDNTVQRRHERLVQFAQLSIAASAAALSADQPDKALEWLVEGRCIVWNQINQLRTPIDKLRAHDLALAERFAAVSKELEVAGSRSESYTDTSGTHRITLEDQASKHIKLAKEWDRLLVTIRNIHGFEDFLQPQKMADIMRDLPDEGVIVIIVVHIDRCDALALMAGAGSPMHIPLPMFSYQESERLARGLHGHLLRRGVISRIGIPLGDVEVPFPEVDLPEVLSVLWSQVVLPILGSLGFSEPKAESKLPRIWWCPTGTLSFLPIHAAGNYFRGENPNNCLSDFAVSSYIPNVNILKMADANSVKTVTGSDVPTGLLIVSQSKAPKKTPIPYAADEAKRISTRIEDRRIPTATLSNESGTIESVLKTMESFPSIHLACHASQNTANPLESAIYLHDGPLPLSEIMKRNLPHSDFAFLSACQTSTGDKNLPEEVVHLAAGMLAAGYRSVVGTMWSILDEHGPVIAEYFYEGLLASVTADDSRIGGNRTAHALHFAIQRFRKKISDSPDSLLVWVPYIHVGR